MRFEPSFPKSDRPVIFDYRAVPEFMTAMLKWRKQTDPRFSIRQSAAQAKVSPGLVTLVASGKRKLTRDRVPAFSSVLGLTREETSFLDRWVALQRTPEKPVAREQAGRPLRKRGEPENHLLADWINLYVKDAAELKGFKADAETLHRLLGGIASPERIGRSLDFLVKNGFLRRTLDGRLVKNTEISTTTDDIPQAKIRQYHKQALDLARRSIDLYPVERRRASAVVMSLNHSSVKELQSLLKEFYERLQVFMEEHSGENEGLYQVLIHMFPIGGTHEGYNEE